MKTKLSMTVITVLMAAVMLFAIGCTNDAPNNTPSVTPGAVVSPIVSPSAAVTTPGTAATPGSTNGGVIENFEEGAVVEAAELPTEIKDAIKAQYPDSTVKTVTYATYENKQMYNVMVENTEDKTTKEFYVAADGTIVPAKAVGSPSPSSSPASETSKPN